MRASRRLLVHWLGFATIAALVLVSGCSSVTSDMYLSATQSNLQTALTGVNTYYQSDSRSFAGLDGGSAVSSIDQIDAAPASELAGEGSNLQPPDPKSGKGPFEAR